jgi:hypothetical protein
MTTYTAATKNTTSYNTAQRSDATTNDGKSLGLLLALTYADTGTTYTSYTALGKNVTTYTALNKN